jgi:ribosomal protein L12E/L44/L45/RPP1/RPP2
MNLDLRTLAPLVCLLVDLGALISLSDSDEAAAAAAAAAAASAAAAAAAAKAACFDNSEKKTQKVLNWKG